ncbi:MAG: hypothetical protein GDA56_29245 [Hormoscilla sp. GM7CHS1pb]|nr:hypothetical protein [Hormoscilla sp. GM7CHS1pb]
MMATVLVGFALGEPVLAIADTVMDKNTGNIDIGKELVVGGSYSVAGLLLLHDIRCAIWEKTCASATPYSNW